MMKHSRLGALAGCAALGLSFWAAQAGDARTGSAVFAQCAVCHDAASGGKKLGPGLKGLFKKPRLADGKAMTEANVRARIEAGGKGMPPYRQLLDAVEKDDLIAYLKTL
jgi:cytochrome c